MLKPQPMLITKSADKWQNLKSLSPLQATEHYGFCPFGGWVCSNISSGLRPTEPSVPAIHPTSKLMGILAYEIKV